MAANNAHMKTLERSAMRRLAISGANISDIQAAFGRSHEAIARHTGQILSMRLRAQRLERLFASCNRALAGGR
jgi:hypothetical protein